MNVEKCETFRLFDFSTFPDPWCRKMHVDVSTVMGSHFSTLWVRESRKVEKSKCFALFDIHGSGKVEKSKSQNVSHFSGQGSLSYNSGNQQEGRQGNGCQIGFPSPATEIRRRRRISVAGDGNPIWQPFPCRPSC